MYYNHGVLYMVGSYSEGQKIGEWKDYYLTGQLRSIENYSTGEQISYPDTTLEKQPHNRRKLNPALGWPKRH